MGYLPYQLASRISAINSINMKNRSKNPVHSTLPDHVNLQQHLKFLFTMLQLESQGMVNHFAQVVNVSSTSFCWS